MKLDNLLPLVYDELRKLARHKMQSERDGHTLQHTALVHEVYLKLVQTDMSFIDRAHFFATAARAMRQILVDHARTKNRDKRGGAFEKVSLDEAVAGPAELDPRQSEILELHYFGGMTHEEMAAVTGVSTTTIDRELRLAKAWIKRELSDHKSWKPL